MPLATMRQKSQDTTSQARCSLREAAEKGVAVVEQLTGCLGEPVGGRDTRRGLAEAARYGLQLQAPCQFTVERRAQHFDLVGAGRLAARGRRFVGLEGLVERERVALGHERAESTS